MSCICQNCGKEYTVDFIISTDIWEKITPDPINPEAGLLCGRCIVEAIEEKFDYECFHLIPEKDHEFS